MAEDFDEKQLDMLKKAFDSFKKPNQDYIAPDNVGAVLRMMEQKYNAQTLKELIAEIDADGSGKIEFDEFLVLAAKFMNEGDEEALKAELKEAFKLYDKDDQGYITNDVFKAILAEIDPLLSDEDLDNMIEEIDEDGSGTLDFDEFLNVMMGE